MMRQTGDKETERKRVEVIAIYRYIYIYKYICMLLLESQRCVDCSSLSFLTYLDIFPVSEEKSCCAVVVVVLCAYVCLLCTCC